MNAYETLAWIVFPALILSGSMALALTSSGLADGWRALGWLILNVSLACILVWSLDHVKTVNDQASAIRNEDQR